MKAPPNLQVNKTLQESVEEYWNRERESKKIWEAEETLYTHECDLWQHTSPPTAHKAIVVNK